MCFNESCPLFNQRSKLVLGKVHTIKVGKAGSALNFLDAQFELSEGLFIVLVQVGERCLHDSSFESIICVLCDKRRCICQFSILLKRAFFEISCPPPSSMSSIVHYYFLIPPLPSLFFLLLPNITIILTQSLTSVNGCSTKIPLREECGCLELIPILSGKGINSSLLGSASLGELLVFTDTVVKKRVRAVWSAKHVNCQHVSITPTHAMVICV